MGFKKNIDISSDELFQKVDDYSIFYAYRGGDLEIGSIESSKFRQDDNPSAGFYYTPEGTLIYNDIATSEKLNAISYVAKLFKISYKKALIKIASDFGLNGEEPKYHKIDPKDAPPKEKEEKRIEVLPDKWSKSYLDYWDQFSLTKEEIEKDVIPVRALFINGKIIPNYSKTIRFAFPLTVEDKTYYKIYSPLVEKGNFKWINNIPLHIPFGILSLPFKSKNLIITKSVKEKLLWDKYFTEVISCQNESASSLRDVTISYLKSKYKTLYISFDIDEAGKSATKYFEEKGFISKQLPDVFYSQHNVKDVAELVAKFGIEKFHSFLKWSKLL